MKLTLVVALSVAVISAAALFGRANGHGKLIDPPGRNAVMNEQFKGADFDPKCTSGNVNWSDKSNFCGGISTQTANGGKCSACGDNYADTYPRAHDYGGTYAQEITPVRVYLQGQAITVKVYVSASHRGRFEFRLCNLVESDEGYRNQDALTKCFNDDFMNTRLYTTDGLAEYRGDDPEVGVTRIGIHNIHLQLPQELTCPRGCTLQWRYITNNSPGLDIQEHFVNCADIIIASCQEYEERKIASYCGYGPTTQLTSCDRNATSSGGSQQQPDPDQGQTGGTDNKGSSTNTDSSGQEWQSGTESSGADCDKNTATHTSGGGNYNTAAPSSGSQQQPGTDGESSGSGQGNTIPSGGSSSNGNTGSSGASSTNYQSLCDECTSSGSQTCGYAFCEKAYVGATSSSFDSYCDVNCKHVPPHCPSSFCKTVWVQKRQYSRILRLLQELLERDDLDGQKDGGK